MGCQHKSLKSELFVHFSPPFTCLKFRLRNSAIASICRVSCHGGLTFCHQLFPKILVAALPEVFRKTCDQKVTPLAPLTKTRLRDFEVSKMGREMTVYIRKNPFLSTTDKSAFPPRRGAFGIWEKCIFPESPYFSPHLLLPAKTRRSFRGIKMREK